MLIDWFTVGAQLVNFIVLVVLLKKLFYRPILKAIAAREERIAKELRDAANMRESAEAELEAIRKQQREIEQHRTELDKHAADEADSSRLKLIASAKEEVAALRQRWVYALKREKEHVEHDLAVTLQAELLALVKTVLRELAGTQLEDVIARKFIAELESMSPGDRDRLQSESNATAVISSSFEMPAQSKFELQHAVEQELGTRTVRFETTPDLVCGVELATAGYKLSWNIQDWLRSFDRTLQEALDKTAPYART